ncbi:MAG TPA: hypothetical protein PKK06_11730 [Phycisphaerae bacterium]|nr:hypothetical protein [Phycisphaerae bacterium]HNU45868.1 hypothetical protein [Phycisphaerae bacterium]
MKSRMLRRVKGGALAALVMGGMLFATSCGVKDIWANIVAGTLAYVKSTTTSILSDNVPLP